MIDKYVEAWENYQRKADEEMNAYERDFKAKYGEDAWGGEDMRYFKIWCKKYPFYVYDEEKEGVLNFVKFIKETFKKDKQ